MRVGYRPCMWLLLACASETGPDSGAPAPFSMAGCRQVETGPDWVVTRVYLDEVRLLTYDRQTAGVHEASAFTRTDACTLSVAWESTWESGDTKDVETGTRVCDDARNAVHTWSTGQYTSAGAVTTKALEETYANTYDTAGQLVRVVESYVDTGGVAALHMDRVYTWEGGHVVQELDTAPDGSTWLTTHTWEADRLMASEVVNSQGDRSRETFAYDVDGRLVEYTQADDGPMDSGTFADWWGERYTYTDATARVRQTAFSRGLWENVVSTSTSTWDCPG